MRSHLRSLAIAGGFILLASVSAIADESRICNLANLESEINGAEKAGTITHEQAVKLTADANQTSKKELDLFSKNNGVLSNKDRNEIQKDCDRIHNSLHKVEAMRQDNTGKNIGDGRTESPTPQVQSESKEDLQVVQAIRKALMKDNSLSMNAKNCKVVVINGTVTLRGPVRSADERDRIGSTAQACVGSGKVLNELQIQ